jgi:DNA-binding transcriptional MerR regulator
MITKTKHLLKIGELAAQSRVSAQAIRYYEELGLLQSSDRTEGNYRLFAPQRVQHLAFIKRLQALGLSLQAVKECLAVYDSGDLPCAVIQQQLHQRVREIEQKIHELTQLRNNLQTVLDHWQAEPEPSPDTICPNLEI